MTTRRQIIQAGAVLGAVAAPGASALAAGPVPAAVAKPLTYHKVAFDSRIRPSLIFAGEARRLGADVHDIDGDITGLYTEYLLDRWRTSPDPVAGMTPYSSMFVLEMMASAAGLRVIYRAHHDGDHALFGPTTVLDKSGGLDGQEFEWSRKAARIVMAWPREATTAAAARSTIAKADNKAVGHDTLVSWILAPTRTA